ncbi:hypothetical protein [Streptomyces agglomeratus]|uniref:hypothetical protein n=1 Tax=Streptomyces agglomeratus TaxID=285458 RepID=UPI0009A0046D|nr:hypothetical protein [Streptomyces agglomeratus]
MVAPDNGRKGTVIAGIASLAAATIYSAGPAGSVARPASTGPASSANASEAAQGKPALRVGSLHLVRAISNGTLPALASIASARRSTSQIR